jgi:hypothetical protein
MVEQGHAVAYTKYSTDYVSSETSARQARRGIWAGQFEYPWDWRQARRAPAGSAKPQDTAQSCVIKGNISSSGERIYHVPGVAFYDRTQISEGKGERWFCSEGDAKSSGWRRSIR